MDWRRHLHAILRGDIVKQTLKTKEILIINISNFSYILINNLFQNINKTNCNQFYITSDISLQN